MAMTALQKRDSARRLGSDLFNGGLLATVSLGTDDLEAAVGSVDAAMDMVISTVPAEWQAKTIKQAIVDNLPEPFQSGCTPAQKALVLSAWAMKEAGLI